MKPFFLALVVFVAPCASQPCFGQKKLLDSLYNLSLDKTRAGDVAGATALLVEATKLAEAENNLPVLCNIQITMGKLGIISENNDAAAKAIEKAESYCGACKDTLSLAKVMLQKGVMLTKQTQYSKAASAFKTSADYFRLKNDSLGAANALAKVGNVLEFEGKYAEAQPYYLQLYDFARKKDPKSVQYMTANIYMCGNCLYLRQYEKAQFHNSEVMRLSKEHGAKYEYAEALRYDAQIHAGLGLHKEAFKKLEHFAKYYQDTLMNAEHLRQSEELKAKYEAEKKEAQIALQKAELSREKLRSWVFLGGLAAALVIGSFFFALARKLRKRNEEKEFLLKEIHHRVKNNLQILSSLLHLQSRQITDGSALDAVREGQSRVDAMGLMHQKLYMGDNVAKVEMKGYLEQFTQNMLDSFGIEDGRVQIQLDVAPVMLDVDTAIPLGLIINELTTNSLKYAFPDGRSGTISISLGRNGKGQQFRLLVADDGVGQAKAAIDEKSTAFGAKLVQMLTKKLKGRLEAPPRERGFATEVVFEA